jgi:tetratricopeptide (TPR) repeat protein
MTRVQRMTLLRVVLCAAGLVSSACAGHRVAADSTLARRIDEIRRAPSSAAAPESSAPQSLETWDPQLAAALADAAAHPSARAERQVALEYRRIGVIDAAFAYFDKAIARDRRDASAFDGRARLWRDSGFPALGLGDAYRAVYLAPKSAAAINTLGTVLEAVGELELARAHYDTAARLDPGAAFPRLNLCHAETMMGKRTAVARCLDAVERVPMSAGAHNNLAVAYATEGDFASAQSAFDKTGDAATAAYNMGIVYMAARRFDAAVSAFRAAERLRPELTLAAWRVQQAEARSTSTR